MRMLFAKRLRVVLLISIALLLLTIMMDFPQRTMSLIGDALVIQDKLSPVDVIHVIAGDDYRTQYAIQLYQQGYAKMLFFTGGWCTFHGYYHGAHALQLAIEAGIPRQAVAYDDSQVLSTYDEALLLSKFIKEDQPAYRAIMVVSDPFHMRRVQWTYRHIFGKNVTTLMAPVPFAQTPFSEHWWTDKASSSYVREEYEKLVYYFFRYQLNIRWLARYDVY
jgi:uncharacterized SAM-binding protein YcdF (DUF218 family)